MRSSSIVTWSEVPTSTPQPVGVGDAQGRRDHTCRSASITAGGSMAIPGSSTGDPHHRPAEAGDVAVRVRGIKSNGAVTIDGQTTTGEILLDGIIDAKGNVSLLATAIRARHSVFAEGGDITVGGQLILEPWGDEIVVGILNPVTITTNTYPTQWTDTGRSAPGSLLTDPPAVATTRRPQAEPGEDVASSQITLRAVRVGGAGGQITLTNGVALEPGVPQPSDDVLAMMRVDQQHVRLDRGAEHQRARPWRGAGQSTDLPLVPLNDIRLNLQADAGVVFRADPVAGTFQFSGVPRRAGLDFRFNNPVGRLTILDGAGNPADGPYSAQDAANPAAPFSGAWTSVNDTRGERR